MRRALPAVLLVLAVLAPAFAFAAREGETVFRVKSFFMTKRIDGKPVGNDMVVDISIEKTDGGYAATWDAVNIRSVELADGVKRTQLRAEHYGTDAGSIIDIVVKEKYITFDIVRSHGDMKVDIFRTGEFGLDIEIKAYGTHSSDRKPQKFAEEWVKTDDIKFPSREIFGYPEKKLKKRH